MAFAGSHASGFPLVRETGTELDNDGSRTIALVNRGTRSHDGYTPVLEKSDNGQNWKYSNGTDGGSSEFGNFEKSGEDGALPDGSTCSSSGADSQKDKYWKALERCIVASTKGFVIGGGLRGGIALFAILSRLKRGKPSVSGKSAADAMKVDLKETLRYGLFLGTFAGSFCTVDEGIAAIGGNRRTARWRALVAGAVAGPSLLLTGHQMRHTSMAIYILMRASVLAARCGIKSKRMGWLCRPLTWKHGDTLLMCLSSSQILYAWIMYPKSLPSSYISFLNKHGGKDTSIVHGLNALASNKGLSDKLLPIEQHYQTKGVNLKLSPDMKIPCSMVHGGQDCVPHFFSFIGNAYLRSLPVYLPVYLVPALLVHRQGLLARRLKSQKKPKWQGRDGDLGFDLEVDGGMARKALLTPLDLFNWRKWPLPLLSKTLLGTARSSVFLATYCASAWLWTCWLFRAVGRCNPALVAAGTFPTGLAVLIEKKSRRMELALYCFSRAVESFAICVSDSGLLKQHNLKVPNRIDVVLFSLATSIIMHCYAEERDVFRSKYLNVLDWVFGIPALKKPAIKPYIQLKDPVLEKSG